MVPYGTMDSVGTRSDKLAVLDSQRRPILAVLTQEGGREGRTEGCQVLAQVQRLCVCVCERERERERE